MNGKKIIDPKVRTRRLVIRLALIALYLGLIAIFFVIGKGHAILIDNRDVSDEILGIDGVLVSVDGREALELYPGDRDRENVRSQSHRVRVEDFNGEVLAEKRFTVPIGTDMIVLSVPKLVAGVEPFLEDFVALAAIVSTESDGSGEQFISPDAVLPEVIPLGETPLENIPDTP
jgi:hypothetical protein